MPIIPARQAALADLCRQLVMETYAPAAVLINHKHECLYSLGPIERYLRAPPGFPTRDLFVMARGDLRTKLRSTLQRAGQKKERVVVSGGETGHSDSRVAFSVAVQPVLSQGEELMLICFIDAPEREQKGGGPIRPQDAPRVAELEWELGAARTELTGAIRNLEIASEEQRAINKEAQSINQEYQATNEELRRSKEELQSLNQELVALNGQLQETLEQQSRTSNDLQNVLYSIDVATLFLDTDLNIRFFTPATKSVFNVIASDMGRPLADLSSLVADGALLSDARSVLQTCAPIEREIAARNGAWYSRRILPYRAHDGGVEGVVITFADITDRRRTTDTLFAAERQAQLANVAKSRFLAAASHDLRQPLQALSLMRGALERKIKEEKYEEALQLVARLDKTAAAMSGMLNALLDINQLEASTVRAKMIRFPIDDLLGRLKDEFAYHAQAQRLVLRVVACGLSICSDPRLLEQMIRNLLSNALKYTKRGKVLLGCRRHQDVLSVEVWDSGVGIADGELQAIFDEYHQVDNAAHERGRGLGLGLSIVRRLGVLLGHRVRVRSRLGRGSVFAVEVTLPPSAEAHQAGISRLHFDEAVAESKHRAGTVLIVEDDPDVRALLELLLREEDHRTATAADGISALDLVARGAIQPDLVLADYNLPNAMDGLQVAAKLRAQLHREVPVIILTGDISANALRDIALHDCVQLNKPVRSKELTQAVQGLLPASQVAAPPLRMPHSVEVGQHSGSVIVVVDDDSHVRDAIREMFEADGQTVEDFATCEAFLEAYRPGREACLVVDA